MSVEIISRLEARIETYTDHLVVMYQNLDNCLKVQETKGKIKGLQEAIKIIRG